MMIPEESRRAIGGRVLVHSFGSMNTRAHYCRPNVTYGASQDEVLLLVDLGNALGGVLAPSEEDDASAQSTASL